MNDGYAKWQFFVKKLLWEAIISNDKLWWVLRDGIKRMKFH
jgi:hypothetical protein